MKRIALILIVVMLATLLSASYAMAQNSQTTTLQATESTPTGDMSIAVEASATVEPTPTPTPEPFSLTIIHTNDIHANHDPDSNGDNGSALAASVIQQIRAKTKNSLLLNAGDNFTGSLYYVVHRGQDSVELMNAIGYDAMTLGNHEFDDGDANLAAFLNDIKFPVVSANLDASANPILKDKILPYTIIEKNGEKIGVIGLLAPETPQMVFKFDPRLVLNSDLEAVVAKNVEELTAKGINKIILLTHIGYGSDLELARKVKGVDIIVGGHSHTLVSNQYTGAAGVYPTVIVNPDGNPVLVVQAGAFGKYVGKLDVEFNYEGILNKWSGDTIQLSRYIMPDDTTAKILVELKEPLKKFTDEEIGESNTLLNGDRAICRFEECNMGNIITDAMRAETEAQVAILNSGSIRDSIAQGKITLGDVIEVLPFNNLVSTFEIKGVDLKAALEHGVSRIDSFEGTGRFLQVSGLRFKYDPKRKAGYRIISVEVYDAASEKYKPLSLSTVYKIASNDFTRNGGDGFTMLAEKAINPYDFGRPLDQILADYIKTNSPVTIDVEGRITALGKK